MQQRATHRLTGLLALAGAILACSGAVDPVAAPPTRAFREPDPAIVRLLTATPPPEAKLHGATGRIALLYREPVVPLERVTRPYLGLAGFRFDPKSRTSGVVAPVTRVEVVDAGTDATAVRTWLPRRPIEHVRFSPDGRLLSAITADDGPAQIALLDLDDGSERTLEAPINPAWGDPCDWVANDAFLCRVVRARPTPLPRDEPAPVVVDHAGGPAPTRTYPNLLENVHEDALFEHYFGVELARVDVEGRMTRIDGPAGLIASVDPSPDGRFAVVTRIEPPYPRLVRANRFPSVLEVWNLERGERLYASRPSGFGVESGDEEEPRDPGWKPGSPTTLGWIETTVSEGVRTDRWLAITEPFATPVELARSPVRIRRFGWTTAGTPYFTTTDRNEPVTRIHVVFEDGPREIWNGRVTNRFDDAGRVIRVDGYDGPVVEFDGAIYVASDGLDAEGPRPFLDRFDLHTGTTRRLYESDPDVFEPVLGIVDPANPELITLRETMHDPPTLHARRGERDRTLRPSVDPYPDLADANRRVVRYERADGVALSATLYTPAGWSPGDPPLPTLVWIYPYEFSDREHAERLDVRSFRFHRISGPSPLAAVVAGYAVLVNPKVPILQEGAEAEQDYLPQLVASVEAAVDSLIASGVTDPERIAVGGRSYGAFSSANLLIHSERFATAVAMSGAYNRTLTPFGFQREKRTFWEATDLYARISPFFHANEVRAPILLVHGAADENPGTPALQARRFFHALVGEGKPARYVELPGEGHHYLARENVLLAAAEMIDWLDRTIGPPPR